MFSLGFPVGFGVGGGEGAKIYEKNIDFVFFCGFSPDFGVCLLVFLVFACDL